MNKILSSNSNQLPVFMTFAFGYSMCCICNVAKTHGTRREVMERKCDSLFVLVNASTWFDKLLAQFLLSILLELTYELWVWNYRKERQRYQDQWDVCQEDYQRSFRFLTFLCALACSSTYFWTSLISSCSFLTNSMWQLASFSVELLNTSHTGAKVLGQTTTR